MKKFKIFTILFSLSLIVSNTANGAVPFYIGDEKFPIKQETVLINSENLPGNMYIQFGQTLNKLFGWLNNAGSIGGSTNGNFFLNEGLVIYEDNTETTAGTGLTVTNAGTGDSLIQLLLNGVQRWVVGIDNSDSDKFKIASSQDLNSDAKLTIDTNGNTGINDANPSSALSLRPNAAIGGSDYLLKAFQTPTQNASQPTFGVVGDGSFAMHLDSDPIWFGAYNGGLIFAGNYNANTELNHLDILANTNWGSVSPSIYGSSNSTASIDAGTGNFQTDGNISIDGAGTNYLLGDTGIGTNTPGSKLDIKGTLRLSGATSGFVGFNAQANAGSTTYTLPASDGNTGDTLTTDGAGTLSWTPSASGSGDITSVGSMTTGDAFTNASASGQWLGLGASAGRIEFDDQSTDEINLLNANIGIKTSTPQSELDIQTNDGAIRIGDSFPNKSTSTDSGISMYNASGDFKSGLFTEVDGTLLSYGINISQLGDRDETKTGGIFRLDTRTGHPYFSIKKQAIGGSAESSDLQITESGDMGLGAWPSDSNSFPATVSILSRATGIIGQVIRGQSGQTANLQEWQNSTATALASLGANGLLSILKTGEAIRLGTATANDVYINFDDGSSRNFGWDDNYSANHPLGTISTFNNELAFRTVQSSNSPTTCNSTVAGMQWFDTDTGMLYICDTSNGRNKWLTTSDHTIYGEESGTCNAGTDPGSSVSCSIEFGGALGSDGNQMGLFLAHPITITGYGFSEDNDACTSGSMDIELWSTGSSVNDQPHTKEVDIATGLNNQAHNATNLNIDVNGNQYINIGIDNNCGKNIDDYNVIIYYRYRHN
ncbi:MAG: hypothetical protein RBS56_02875 [Candidatus Gracilibacteria bacterium]|jgi:hypothetical protein|nr:hypothetical protein [Candidatus Gracilibacteria bacterium]